MNGFNHLLELYPNNEYVINIGKNELCRKTANTVNSYNDVLKFRQKFGNKTDYDDNMIQNVYKYLSISEIMNLIDMYPNSPISTNAGEYAIEEKAKYFSEIYQFLKYNTRFDIAISNVVEKKVNNGVSYPNSEKKFKPLLLKVVAPVNKHNLSKDVDNGFLTYSDVNEIVVDGKYLILGRITNPFNKDTTISIVMNCDREEDGGNKKHIYGNYTFKLSTSKPIFIKLNANNSSYFAFAIDFERYAFLTTGLLMMVEKHSTISNIYFSWKYINQKNTIVNPDEDEQRYLISRTLLELPFTCTEPYGVNTKTGEKYKYDVVKKKKIEDDQEMLEWRNEKFKMLRERKSLGLPSYELVISYFDKIHDRYQWEINSYGPIYNQETNKPSLMLIYKKDGYWNSDYGHILVPDNSTFEQAAQWASENLY